jgi:hypothetical protein
MDKNVIEIIKDVMITFSKKQFISTCFVGPKYPELSFIQTAR